MKYPHHLNLLIEQLKKLPGVGTKSAERFAFQMLDWPESSIRTFAQTVQDLPVKLSLCPECGCLMSDKECLFCKTARVTDTLCVVATPREVYSLNATGEYRGLYHVLGGLLSPIDGIGPSQLNMRTLIDRIRKYNIHEVVLALDSTLEGDATALYLKQELEPLGLHISRLAFGLPMGSSLDYVDSGTLARALTSRGKF